MKLGEGQTTDYLSYVQDIKKYSGGVCAKTTETENYY